ncbi:uncharacterized protein LOC118458293 [Anopheles albimanus]|uniref:Uncharacterized protein n=1 Tax=Anopheles albimanus TaxID=7167 RepID=A0A182F9C5_ANOAL|nr:uncharacterized protein LOC118458293 [Anopheles albimanus]
MAHRMVVCIPVATVLLLLPLTPRTLGAPTVHLGAPLQESQPGQGAHGIGAQDSLDRNSATDRPFIVEPAWFTVTTSPIGAPDAAAAQLTGRVAMPVLPAQPATMRPYVAYIPIAPAPYQRPLLPPGWPAYLPGVLPAYPMPWHNQLCNQPSPNGYQPM